MPTRQKTHDLTSLAARQLFRAARRIAFLGLAVLTLALAFAPLRSAQAAEKPEFVLIIKDHKFVPAELKVPAGTKIKLIIRNEDPTPEEFESYDLNREKIVRGNSEIKIFVGPLKPGTYEFFGEFHMETALGRLIAE